MENKDLLIRILDIEGGTYLRQGDYSLAEKRFKDQYQLFFEIQKERKIRIHKGAPLHNIGLALLFQGKTDDAIRFIVFAYVEDLISAKQNVDADLLPASRVLRGLCGATWEDLSSIESTIAEEKIKGVLNPEDVESRIKESIAFIQSNYREYLGCSWQLEVNGQRKIAQEEYEGAKESYSEWLDLLYKYQKKRPEHIHKGHPLANLGFICLRQNMISDALDYLIQAHIENIISSRVPVHIKESSSFKVLVELGVGVDILESITEWIQDKKSRKEDLLSPETLKKGFFLEKKISPPEKTTPIKEIKPETIEKTISAKKTIDQLPGTYRERVFIGGSYGGGYVDRLKEVAEYVESLGYYPVIAMDYDPPRDENDKPLLNVHDFDVLLIHMCNHAIFELSEAAGQYNEIEWSIRFLRKHTLGICEQGKESRISTLIQDLFKEANESIFYYSASSSMKDHIRSKLPPRKAAK